MSREAFLLRHERHLYKIKSSKMAHFVFSSCTRCSHLRTMRHTRWIVTWSPWCTFHERWPKTPHLNKGAFRQIHEDVWREFNHVRSSHAPACVHVKKHLLLSYSHQNDCTSVVVHMCSKSEYHTVSFLSDKYLKKQVANMNKMDLKSHIVFVCKCWYHACMDHL
jgi:hypothetical protein